MAETPSGLATVTSTHMGPGASGGTTEIEFSPSATIGAVAGEPKLTAVALAKPLPEIVMAPLPLSGPVLGLTADTEGQPSPPWIERARFGSTGVPSPLAAS